MLGSFHTLKATLPYLVESADKHKVDSNTREFFADMLEDRGRC